MTPPNFKIARNDKNFIYRSPVSARNIRSTKGISRIKALRAYNPYSLWGGSKMSDSPFIHESSNRDVYVIGSEARRQASTF